MGVVSAKEREFLTEQSGWVLPSTSQQTKPQLERLAHLILQVGMFGSMLLLMVLNSEDCQSFFFSFFFFVLR